MTIQRPQDIIRDNLNIPTLPEVVQRIGRMIEDPEVGTAEIGAVVSEDAPLAAKVLRIANSAFYGLHERCLSTEQATSVLGVRVLKNVVTQAAVIQHFAHLEAYSGFDIDEIWRHSSMVAHACSLLARASKLRTDLTPDEFHVCGLLHDLGKVVMLDGLGEGYVDVFRAAKRGDGRLHELEKREFGFDHTEVGALVAHHWSLPEDVAKAIRYHHGPRERVAEDPVVSLVAHANLVCHWLAEGKLEAARASLDEETLGCLGIEGSGVESVLEEILEAHQQALI